MCVKIEHVCKLCLKIVKFRKICCRNSELSRNQQIIVHMCNSILSLRRWETGVKWSFIPHRRLGRDHQSPWRLPTCGRRVVRQARRRMPWTVGPLDKAVARSSVVIHVIWVWRGGCLDHAVFVRELPSLLPATGCTVVSCRSRSVCCSVCPPQFSVEHQLREGQQVCQAPGVGDDS